MSNTAADPQIVLELQHLRQEISALWNAVNAGRKKTKSDISPTYYGKSDTDIEQHHVSIGIPRPDWVRLQLEQHPDAATANTFYVSVRGSQPNVYPLWHQAFVQSYKKSNGYMLAKSNFEEAMDFYTKCYYARDGQPCLQKIYEPPHDFGGITTPFPSDRHTIQHPDELKTWLEIHDEDQSQVFVVVVRGINLGVFEEKSVLASQNTEHNACLSFERVGFRSALAAYEHAYQYKYLSFL